MEALHDHSHHGTKESDFRPRLAIAFGLAALIVIAQTVGSFITGSLALLTDTAHALVDASGLLVALMAAALSQRPTTSRQTWGFKRVEVLAALAQSVLLLAAGVYTVVEGIHRLFTPPEVPPAELLIFGIIGLAANLVGILVLSSHREANFNMRAAFLEVLHDALGSCPVIIASVVIALTGFMQADALAGLFIAVLIVPRAVRLLWETTSVLMEFTPKNLDLDTMRAHILNVDGVVEVHDVHASTIATGMPAVTAHVVVVDNSFTDGSATAILRQIRSCLAEHFDISVKHSTFQLETVDIGAEEPESVKHP